MDVITTTTKKPPRRKRTRDIKKNPEDIDALKNDFVAYRLDRSTVLRPFILGKDDLDFLDELLLKPGTDFDPEQMKEGGRCFVAVRRGVVVGTVTYKGPGECMGNQWFDREEVACFNLMAVHPECRDDGLGTRMLIAVEKMARKDGALELVVDLPEESAQLHDFFRDRGYRTIGLDEKKLVSKKFLRKPLIFGEYTAVNEISNPNLTDSID